MHELSIAQNIVEIIRQSVSGSDMSAVRVVKMKVGTFSGVFADSLEFCFSAIAAQTDLSRARLEIQHVPFEVRCRACDKTFANDIGMMICPECNGTDTEVLSGRELQVTELELDNGEGRTP